MLMSNSWMDNVHSWYCYQEDFDISVVVLNKTYKQLKVILEEKYTDFHLNDWHTRKQF